MQARRNRPGGTMMTEDSELEPLGALLTSPRLGPGDHGNQMSSPKFGARSPH